MNITRYSSRTSGTILATFQKISQDLPNSHQIALRLFKRDLKARYRQSVLGLFWAVFPPLLTAGLWIFLKSNKVANFDETAIPYPIFVFTGTMLWQIFAEAFNKPLQIISANKSVLVKMNIPTESLILSGFYDTIFKTIIKVGLLFIIFLVFDISPTWNLALFPIGIFGMVLSGFSFGIFIVPIGMLYDDIKQFVGIGLPLLMYLSPVVYPMHETGVVGIIMKFNPLATLINTSRNMFTGQPVEEFWQFILLVFFLFVILLLGLVVFKKSIPLIIERTGS